MNAVIRVVDEQGNRIGEAVINAEGIADITYDHSQLGKGINRLLLNTPSGHYSLRGQRGYTG